MIRGKDEYTAEYRPCGGSKENFEVRTFYSKDEMYGKSRLFAEIVFQPGDLLPMHDHTGEVEIFHMLEGELVSIDGDGAEAPFCEGDYMATGGGNKHSMRNDSDKPARIMAIIVL